MTHLRGIKPALSPHGDPLDKAPSAPKRLTEEARAEWRRIMPRLVADRIITRADLAGVENYCIAIGVVNRIADLMNSMPIPDLKLGGLQIRYMQTARQLAAEYGLSPVSRARVGSGANDNEDDEPNPLLIGRSRPHA
jgi:P27 family predicted phage terminase small subunit